MSGESDIEQEFDNFLLQILEDLLELIPTSETGSIQIREGDVVKFRVAKGFDIEKLKQCVFEPGTDIKLIEDSETTNLITNLQEWDVQNLSEQQLYILRKYGGFDTIKVLIKHQLIVDNQVWGYINIESHTDEHAFNQEDAQLVEKFKKIVEMLLKAKENYFELTDHVSALQKELDRNYVLYEKFSHDLRNRFQELLLLLGISQQRCNNEVTRELTNEIRLVDILGDKLQHYELDFTSILTNQSILRSLIHEILKVSPGVEGCSIHMLFNKNADLDLDSSFETIMGVGIKTAYLMETQVLFPNSTFFLFEDYEIKSIIIYINEEMNDHLSAQGKDQVIKKQFLLLFFLQFQNKMLEYIYSRLQEGKKYYRSLMQFYEDEVDPIVQKLSQIELGGELQVKWMQSITKTQTALSEIKKLIRSKPL